jgi:hypothetical protein
MFLPPRFPLSAFLVFEGRQLKAYKACCDLCISLIICFNVEGYLVDIYKHYHHAEPQLIAIEQIWCHSVSFLNPEFNNK